jgi:hypothetical protein
VNNRAEFLTAGEVCRLMGISYASLRGRLRYARIKVKYESRARGTQRGATRELRLSVASLIEYRWLDEEQLAHLATPLNTPGNQLLASRIVRKHHAEYEPMEREFLVQACGANWVALKKSVITELLAKRVGKSAAWLRRDHTGEDGRTKKADVLDRMTHEQQLKVKFHFATARSLKRFADLCKMEPELPQYSYSTWRRVYATLNKTHADMKLLAQRGEIALKQNTPHGLRDRCTLHLMEVCSTDYWRVDVITRWPDGSYVSPYICALRDERTTKILGSAVTKHPNSLGVKTAIFSTIANYGCFDILHMDNGMEFVNVRITGKGRVRSERTKVSL